MSERSPVSLRRYRRRILTLGVVAFLVIFAIGATLTIPVLQNDLEDRVERALDEQDIGGVTASFSGQDGTLVCAEPLADPAGAVRTSAALEGVRVIELDSTCTDGEESAGDDVGQVGETASSTSSSSVTPTSSTAGPAETSTSAGSSTTGGQSTNDSDLPSIGEVLAEDPLFGQLSELVDSVGLDDETGLGRSGPITLFAPTDAAFDEAFEMLGADAFGALTSDQPVVRRLLLGHLTEGELTSDRFVDGPIEMLDGSTVDIDAEVPTFSSGGSTAGVADPETQLDIRASNGVIHAIDRILIPADFEMPTGPTAPAATTVEYVDGRVNLAGAVADADQRSQLRAAAETAVDSSNITDGLTVVEAGAPTAEQIDRMAVVTARMVNSLVSGEATLENGTIAVTGIPLGPNGSGSMSDLNSTDGISVELADRPLADPDSARDLQDELNEFVVANPIGWAAESIELTPGSVPIVDQLAARAARLDGIDIEIVGYTDSAGSAPTNQLFSLGRANSVRDVFVSRGVTQDAVTSEGRGETDPILRPDGTEDDEASRRVEFVVTSR